MSEIALLVGAAVVKVATKVWLGAPFATTATEAGVDTVSQVIQTRVAGKLEQRRVRRQFEQLEETVADRVLTVLGHEFAGVPANEREAAALAVADTFDAARLADTELFAQDLDPLYLERHIRATTPIRVRDLSPGAVALFDRILAECCTYVILLSTALPTFNSAAFTEILRRERTLIDKVDELLARVPEPEPADGDRAAAEFATAYRRHIMARLDRLDLFGADVRTRRYPLTLAYVGLNAIGPSAVSATPELGRPADAGIEEILASTRRLLLRGNAGSGKTTLLQWLAVRAAGRDFPDRLQGWNDHIPFLVRLREYVDRGLPSPAALLRSTGRHLRYAMPEGWVEELLSSGRALVLIDGVDELPERKRPAVRRWLRDLVEDFPAARYVVTSRPAAVSEGWLDDDGFTSAELAPMGPGQIRGFIENWHEAVRSETVDVEERERLDRYEERLRETVLSARHLRGLASTPLLCALLCALNRDRHARLPDSRMEIYEAALTMLLERRDTEREVEGDVRLTGPQRRMLLRDLAHWLIRNGLSDTEQDRAAAQITRSLALLPDLGASAEEVLQHLMERTGLLQAPAVDRVGFVHRTFEEYLAAEAYVAADDLEQLSRRAHKDSWHQVLVMAAGHARGEQRERFFHALFERADAHKPRMDRIHMVALAALETAGELPAELRAEIMRRADPLLPPRTMKQAEAVIAGGQSALRVIAKRSIKGNAQAAATIRTAAAIGGPDALDIIARCAKRDSPKIRREIREAWPNFTASSFAKRVLSGSALVDQLTVNNEEQLRSCALIKGLRGLIVNLGPDLRSIETLPSLRQLDLAFLNVNGWPCDLTVLRSCAGLTSLGLWRPAADLDLPSVLPPHRLKVLLLSHPTGLKLPDDLHRLPQLERVKGLQLSNAGITDLAGFTRWEDTLIYLDLNGNPVEDLSPARSLRRLETIDLSGTNITSIEPLAGHASLAEVLLHDMPNPLDLAPLREIPNLRAVRLRSAAAPDLSALAGIRGVEITVPRGQRAIGEELLGKGSRVVRG